MTSTNITVFAGPTISAAQVGDISPAAVTRPPAARGDLLACSWRAGDTAILIDGFFRERRSVGHKEVLWLLGEGVTVIGAASMGALRAVELAPYGMAGVGQVYRMFSTGEIDGDDEVGVLHGPAERGYPAQTVALVNLRHGCHEGARLGLINAGDAERVIAAAKALPFTFRSWDDLAREAGTGARPAVALLRERIASGEWDIKHRDAVAAVRLAAHPSPAAPSSPAAPLTTISRSWLLAARSRRPSAAGRWMSDLDVLTACRLFDESYPQLHTEVLAGLLTGLAAAAGLAVPAYASARLGLRDGAVLPAALAAWLTEPERDGLPQAARLALVMTRAWPVWHSADWRPAMIARLQARGQWTAWSRVVQLADEAAASATRRVVIPPPAICGRLFLRHWLRDGTTPEIELARRGFTSLDDLGQAAARFFAFDLDRARATAPSPAFAR
jgi:hypothetical protein